MGWKFFASNVTFAIIECKIQMSQLTSNESVNWLNISLIVCVNWDHLHVLMTVNLREANIIIWIKMVNREKCKRLFRLRISSDNISTNDMILKHFHGNFIILIMDTLMIPIF